MITILTIGQTKDKHILVLIQEYLKRLSSEKIMIKTIKEEKGNVSEVVRKREGERLLETIEKIKENTFVIALSEEGKLMNSIAFADFLKKKQMEKNIVFVVGGAFGLDSVVKERANLVLSLSSMTFPHEMALLVLVEQLYRVYTLQKGIKYHK